MVYGFRTPLTRIRDTDRFAPPGPVRVLVVDHGQSFGGTVVVASMLLRHVPASAAQFCLVTAAADEFARARLAGEYDVHYEGPRFSYASEARLKEHLETVRNEPLRRLLNRALSTAGSLLNAGYVLRLLGLARSRRVQVVHCNNTVNVEAVLVAAMLKLPCVFHAHGMGQHDRFVRWLLSRVQGRFIAISEAVRADLLANGIPASRIELLYNPVELPARAASEAAQLRAEERDALGVSVRAVVAGIVGRVVRWKGQQEFLAACERAFAHCPELHAVIVGDASDLGDAYYAELRAKVRASAFGSRIHFRGFVNDADRIYAPLDILVHSSIEPEPFGLVITEAMIRGLPVIAAHTGAPPELIENGVTGFIHDPADVAGVAEQLLALCRSDTLRHRIGKAARAAVCERHDVKQYGERVVQVYRSLCAPA